MVRSKKTMAVVATEDLHLLDDCGEHVFTFLLTNRFLDLGSLSLVSKQFLSITNRCKFSLTVYDQTPPSLFHRFPNLTSLDLTSFRYGDLDALLFQISDSPLHLKSLNLSNHYTIPSNGLKALAKKMKTSLKSLICSNMGSLYLSDLHLIAHCFPFLEELDLSFPRRIYSWNSYHFNHGLKTLFSALPNLRKVNLSRNYEISDSSLFHLCKNCDLLEEIVMVNCELLTNDGIASVIRERPTLRSFSVTDTAKGGNKLQVYAWGELTPHKNNEDNHLQKNL